MKRIKFINRPTRLSDMNFEYYYENYTDGWQDNKLQRVQISQWRRLKRQQV